MKRHLVMDLFHGAENTPVGDWTTQHPDIESKGAKVLVRLNDNTERFAYFYSDKPHGSYFYDCKTSEPLNPKEWKLLRKNND